jgi:SNF2 family DNA or RNA helicase
VRVTFEKPNRFVLTCSYEQRSIAREHKFIWDADSRYWFTTQFEHAAKLREYFDEDLKKRIKRFSVVKKPWLGSVPPLPYGVKLLPHQERGVKFALERNHSYISFDMGLGKTLTSIAVINSVYAKTEGAKRANFKALIIVPPFLIHNWMKEIHKFKAFRFFVNVLRKASDELKAEDIVIVPDSIVHVPEVFENLMAHRWNVIVVDEAQRFLNAETKRTISVLGDEAKRGIVHRGAKVVMLSGTPMRSGHMELWPVLRSLAWNSIDYMSRHRYGLEYCGAHQVEAYRGKFVWDYSGSTNSKSLREKIEGTFFLTEKLEANVKELKGLLLERVVVLDHKLKAKVFKLDESLRVEARPLEDLVKGAELGDIATYRRELSLEKVMPAVQYVQNILDSSNDQVLVFFYHTEALELFSEKMKRYGVEIINGETPMKTRDKITEGFQAKKFRVLSANIFTMVGLNLTNAKRIVFVESSWNSTDNDQAKARAYRIGQDKLVTVDHLTLADTLDEYVLNKVIKKRNLIDKVFNHQPKR